MSKVFCSPTQTWISTADTELKIADITITNISSNEIRTSTLPIIEISELSHAIRQQITSTLSGDLYILTTKGGVSGCNVTFLDRVKHRCNSANGLDSAIAVYNDIRKAPETYRITLKIFDADERSTVLSTFTGVAAGCSIRATIKEDSSLLFVTFELVGVWE